MDQKKSQYKKININQTKNRHVITFILSFVVKERRNSNNKPENRKSQLDAEYMWLGRYDLVQGENDLLLVK